MIYEGASMERGPVLCACGDKLPIGTYYAADEGSVHVHHGRTECRICDHPDRKDAKDLRTQPVPQPPGATCEVIIGRDFDEDHAAPCGNLLPCLDHPSVCEVEARVAPNLERGPCRCYPAPGQPSGDVDGCRVRNRYGELCGRAHATEEHAAWSERIRSEGGGR